MYVTMIGQLSDGTVIPIPPVSLTLIASWSL